MNIRKAVLGTMVATVSGAMLSQAVLAEEAKDKELKGKTGDTKTEKSVKDKNSTDGKTAKNQKSCPPEGKAKNGKECLGCGKG